MRGLRLLVLVGAALVTGLAFAHVLEMPQKLGYDAARYADVQHSMYAYFAIIGGPLEVATIVLSAVLTWRLRRTGEFRWSLLGTSLLVAALVVWAVVVNGANAAMADWDASAMPADWESVRDRWEYGHVAHWILIFGGYLVHQWSALSAGRER